VNILSKVTWKSMEKNRPRTIATILGVIVSAAMFMAVVTLAWSIRDYMVRGYRFINGDFFVSFSYKFKHFRAILTTLFFNISGRLTMSMCSVSIKLVCFAVHNVNCTDKLSIFNNRKLCRNNA